MKRMISGLLDILCKRSWQTVCLPELFLAVVSCFWFVSNRPKANAYDIRPQQITVFLTYLAVCAAIKLFLYFVVFREKNAGRLSWDYISFFLAMIELGWFFDLYIVGWSGNRSVKEIVSYVLDWYQPLLVIVLAGLIAAVIIGRIHVPFLRKLRHRRRRRSRRASKQQEPAQSRLQIIRARVKTELRSPTVLVTLLILYTVAGMLLFFRFRHISVYDLAGLNLRNKFCEGIKLGLFTLLFLFQSARKTAPDQTDGLSDAAAGIMSFAACILTAGMYLLASESGSAIILVLFAIFMVLYFFSRGWGIALAEMSVLAYLTGWVMERSFRKNGYPAFLTETIGLERWNRLYHLEKFPQVLELRSVMKQSPLLRGLVPYNVSMTGKAYTRIEDFSYMNLVSVFGKVAAVAVIGYYLILLLRVFFRLDDNVLRRRRTLTGLNRNLFILAQYMCLYIVTHAAVHVVSNLTFLFFTGVPLPFLSKGMSNLIVVLLFSVLIIWCLREEEEHGTERKKARRSGR